MKTKITIVSAGRFWAFYLAEQMRQRGCLQTLYTAYPKYKVDAPLRPYARTFPWLFTPYMVTEKWECRALFQWLKWPAIDIFDRWAARELELASKGQVIGYFHQKLY